MRLYLDHAATSWPKAPGVPEAVEKWYRELGVSAERGDGSRCALVAAEVTALRSALGALCGVPAERVAFTSGATEALNLVLRAVLRPGDRVLTTAFEHSSVVRPLRTLERERGIEIQVLPPDGTGALDTDAAVEALAAHPTRLFVFTHASNVTGAVLDATTLCTAARAADAITLLDASQSAGHLPLEVGADVVVASAHKGMLGPPGVGFVAATPNLELTPQKQGGTGSSRALEEHPVRWPTAFEAGTPNTPALLGWRRALTWLGEQDPAENLLAVLCWLDELAEELATWPGLRLHGPDPGVQRLPILSFVAAGWDPAEIGALLDGAGIHVRTGFHCAPWIHRHLATADAGTVRISPGRGCGPGDTRAVLEALAPLRT